MSYFHSTHCTPSYCYCTERALAWIDRAKLQVEFKHDATTLHDEYRSQFHRVNQVKPDGCIRDYRGRINRGQRS